ncbi:centrosomal protein of 164 kDa-like [Rhineura floridana]|uniref:centrosomal protein of 164 kDa-like n=1 Tax=Rhineura floridana TaxID=261503 RepID=UPI002AC802B3|nr:centrosomal protein of 164 kDa-like [Rhineura floridana]
MALFSWSRLAPDNFSAALRCAAKQRRRLSTNGSAPAAPRPTVARRPWPGTFHGCKGVLRGGSAQQQQRREAGSGGESRCGAAAECTGRPAGSCEGDGMASAMLKEVLEGGKQEGANAGVMKVPSALYPERPGPRAKDHCDYLLDSIDAQLSQLQIQGPSGPTKGVGDNGKASLDRTACTSTAPDGNLQDKHHGPPSGQNEGWMEHFRGKLVAAAAGLDTEKALSSPPQRDLLRSVGPSDSEEEEEFARLCTTSTHRTSEIWKQDPRKAADPGWKGAEREGHRNHKHVALELETVQEALEKSQKEARRLELHAEERRSKAEEARADLVLLEYKREACRREMLALEQELSVLRRQCSQYGAAQAEQVSQLVTEREMLKDQVRHLEDNLSSLKHQLRTSKAELTSTKEAAEARTEQLQEAVLSEKELELSRLCEEHERRMEILQQEALQEKVKELAQLREELQGEKSQALQEFAVSAEQAKAKAFQEQAATFGKEIEDLRKTVKERDAEIARQQVATKQQAKVLKQEATEMVEHALLQERKKWEAETRAALQMQREALEEQDRRMQVDLQEAQQKERKSSLASQDETADLRKRIQELEIQARTSECEKRGATDELQVLLQEEKAHALRRLREELEQERMQEKEEGRTTLQQMEDTQRLLLAEQREAAFRARDSQEALSALADRSVAREVAVACLRLQDLLPQKSDMPTLTQMLQGSPALLSSSRALQALREVTEETQRYLQDLKREAEVQRHSALQFQGEKERELRQQQGQLHLESQAALEALKERLFQAHMKDIATLQRSWVREAGAKGHPSRRPQLQKDGEVQPSQRNVTCWRAKAARQLAKEFKEDLAAEVERRRSRNKSGDFPGDLEASESELGQFSMSQCEYPCFACSPSPNGAPFTSQRLFGTPELLHHPQSRTQELRAENTTYCRGSVDHRGGLWEDLVNTSRSKARRHCATTSCIRPALLPAFQRPLTAELASPHLQGKSSWK